MLVCVADVRGSAPRAPGTVMMVFAERVIGTIGGGALEFECVLEARRRLATGSDIPGLRRFALGPMLGQCCGGVAEVLFHLTLAHDPWVTRLGALAQSDTPSVLVIEVDEPGGTIAIVTAADHWVWRGPSRSDGGSGGQELPRRPLERARLLLESGEEGAVVRKQSGAAFQSSTFVLARTHLPQTSLFLFGAGHVGKAIAQLMGPLPFSVTWVDSRAAEFPGDGAANVQVAVELDPAMRVESAPAGAFYLVMTHSHPMDFAICERVLRRGDAQYLGLIGSATKRRRFDAHLRSLGYADTSIDSVVCPIGLAAIVSKRPAEIAVGVVAQLLSLLERGVPTRSRSVNKNV
ncbi:MAG: xanthine dehydrogenase accessory protein XdhC [Chromatiales bacterium]|jgi:xanthine dehydrogenase accessory factor|nr:xanthine dehydrogenase accessory protein XdhC [Chromatiales bacterium]